MKQLLVLISAAVIFSTVARAQSVPSMMPSAVHNAVASAAGCAVEGVKFGDLADKTTWQIQYDASCTSAQQSAGNTALSSFDIAGWNAAQAAQAQFQAALSAGIALSSAGARSLNGTYALDAQAQFAMTAEITAINTNNAFTNGAATKPWLDRAGNPHVFTIAQFKAFATAAAAYVDALSMAAAGQGTWPEASATIP